jgi:hypothetical protein
MRFAELADLSAPGDCIDVRQHPVDDHPGESDHMQRLRASAAQFALNTP